MRDVPAFVALAALIIATPGKDTLLTVRNVVGGRRVGGIWTALGDATGMATWRFLSAVGVIAMLVSFEGALELLRIVGAAYLLLLGARGVWQSLGSPSKPIRSDPSAGAPTVSPRGAFCQGLFSNLSNPKIAVFFSGLLPRFATTFIPLLGLGLLFCAMTLAWLSAYVLVVDRATFLKRPRSRRTLELATGVTLIALGLHFATERS